MATVLHGHPRFTAELDLRLENPGRAIDALLAIGLAPLLPVDVRGFADRDVRQRWVSDRHLMVFTMVDPADPFRQVDLFAEDPIPFDNLWAHSVCMRLGSISVQVSSIADLIAMKLAAGRPQDLADVAALELIRGGD